MKAIFFTVLFNTAFGLATSASASSAALDANCRPQFGAIFPDDIVLIQVSGVTFVPGGHQQLKVFVVTRERLRTIVTGDAKTTEGDADIFMWDLFEEGSYLYVNKDGTGYFGRVAETAEPIRCHFQRR